MSENEKNFCGLKYFFTIFYDFLRFFTIFFNIFYKKYIFLFFSYQFTIKNKNSLKIFFSCKNCKKFLIGSEKNFLILDIF